MSRNKRKKYEQAISAPFFQPQTGATLADKLKELVAGLFAPQAKTETPSADEIIEYYLTPREREVAALIAQGKSNREIAEALVLTAPTVKTHVGNILSKLGFTTRAQIAAWAVEKQLAYK